MLIISLIIADRIIAAFHSLSLIALQLAFHHKTANIQDGARLDISVNGFWGGRYEKCYIDVRVFNPFAPSNTEWLSLAYSPVIESTNL